MHQNKTIKQNDTLKEPSVIPAGFRAAIQHKDGGHMTPQTSMTMPTTMDEFTGNKLQKLDVP